MGFKTLLYTFLVSTVKCCPSSCICNWENDKQIVECPWKNLENIPENIDFATQTLDLSGNNFQPDYDFKNFASLQKLFLKNCQITSLKKDVFEGLTNLIHLDLSDNLLENIPLEALMPCPSLTSLNLSKNPIKTLKKLAFNNLNMLQNIDLSSCELTQISSEAFSNLHNLEWLDLSQNKLENFPQIPMPQTLKGVQLHGNRWVCDCKIKPLSAWLKIYPVLVAPICEEPRKFRGLPVRGLNDSELSCESQDFEVEESQNVTLICEDWKNETVTLFLSGLDIIEDNRTYYCSAKGNFTVIVLPKRENVIKLAQEDKKLSIIPILLAAGLIVSSLCLVALIMTLIKHQGKTRSVKPEVIGNFIGTSSKVPQIRRQRTLAYLNPTLKSNFRPVSAPSFERYVENYDLNLDK
ncbi:unnamed protein product [Ceutorhynchus assimilis]|uniref:LRRCT domain-containing protein n=1 Tax=Ceutorhynchus assimilis TaxID=467358 RepID=A0A9N9QML6_9CUCU|nr:unnamed protein product [Ceutorhynchus assimilis]